MKAWYERVSITGRETDRVNSKELDPKQRRQKCKAKKMNDGEIAVDDWTLRNDHIYVTDFGPVLYHSASLVNGNSHLMSLNQEAGRHKSETKPRTTSYVSTK